METTTKNEPKRFRLMLADMDGTVIDSAVVTNDGLEAAPGSDAEDDLYVCTEASRAGPIYGVEGFLVDAIRKHLRAIGQEV